MIIEIYQLFIILTRGYLYYLPLHLIVFVLTPLIIRSIKAKRHRAKHSLERRSVRVSVVIPEHKEDLELFEECLKSVRRNNPDEIIVVHDDNVSEVARVASKYGAKVISSSKRIGKRKCMVMGWLEASGDIVVHVDSDTVLGDNAIDEIIKPFSDEDVVGVQGKPLIEISRSWLSYRLSEIIEYNRDLNNKALNGCLVVIDGRFNAWRRDFLLRIKDDFLNEKFLGRRCEIGDDRFLTQRANLLGYRTVYQETAVAKTIAPPNYMKFLKQQLRWARSGYKAFFLDVKIGLIKKVPLTYIVFQFTYYLSPLSFTYALVHDILFTQPVLQIPIWAVVPIAIIGSGFIVLVRRLALGLFRITLKEFFIMGATALFISYPLMLVALATIHKQSTWLTR